MNEFDRLVARVGKLENELALRRKQQFRHPLDLPSKDLILSFIPEDVVNLGLGATALTQTINVNAVPASFSVPKAYVDSILLRFANSPSVYEIPYIAINP